VSLLDQFQVLRRTALVTGASAGIGAAIAIALAEAGADVICHGHTHPAEQTCEAIAKLGRRAFALQADLRQPDAAVSLFERARQYAIPDILVNNAGVIRRASAVDYSDEDWDTVLQVNLTSLWKLSKCIGRALIESKRRGKIVNVASLLSFQGGIMVPAYTASKGAVAQLTKALANEWAGHGINVNAIAPGYIRTENTLALQRDETRNRQILERIPAGRWGEPGDIAAAAVFLAAPASDYMHGHVLVVDGGWMGR
jgi:2-dehydro-3-deoxy-D-gluconate 5-dehydrogenase